MKKLLLAIATFFAFTTFAFAAVNLNTATKDELDSVKGIGPVKAQAIIDYRTKNGAFKSVDDLKNVNGFGDKTVAKMRSELSVGGGAAAKKSDAKADSKPAAAAKPEAKPAAKADAAKLDAKPGKADAKAAAAKK